MCLFLSYRSQMYLPPAITQSRKEEEELNSLFYASASARGEHTSTLVSKFLQIWTTNHSEDLAFFSDMFSLSSPGQNRTSSRPAPNFNLTFGEVTLNESLEMPFLSTPGTLEKGSLLLLHALTWKEEGLPERELGSPTTQDVKKAVCRNGRRRTGAIATISRKGRGIEEIGVKEVLFGWVDAVANCQPRLLIKYGLRFKSGLCSKEK